MRKIFYKLLIFIAILTSLGAFASTSVLAKAAPLRVALSNDLLPLHGFSQGRALGFEADLARLLAKKMGRSIEFVDLERLEKGSFAALENEDVDISINSIPQSTKVKGAMAMSDPYLTLHFRLVGKSGAKIKDPTTTTVKIAVLDRAARDLIKKRMPEAKFVPQQSIKSAISALMRGEVQFVAHDEAVLSEAIKGTKLSMLPRSYGEIALSIAAPGPRIAMYNKLLKKLKPQIKKLQKKWLAAAKPIDMNALLSTWPKQWVGLSTKAGRQVIAVRCDNSPDRIALSQRDSGWYLEFQLGADSVDGRISKIEKLGAHHYRLHYLRQSIELRYKPGSKTAQWGKSTELWRGAWHSFADAKNEKSYRALRLKKCP